MPGWSYALDLLSSMRREDVEPNTIHYWYHSFNIYMNAQCMQHEGVVPNTIQYSAAINACNKYMQEGVRVDLRVRLLCNPVCSQSMCAHCTAHDTDISTIVAPSAFTWWVFTLVPHHIKGVEGAQA